MHDKVNKRLVSWSLFFIQLVFCGEFIGLLCCVLILSLFTEVKLINHRYPWQVFLANSQKSLPNELFTGGETIIVNNEQIVHALR